MELSRQHLTILREIGTEGAPPAALRSYGREFTELDHAGLIVFWAVDGVRPMLIFGGGTVPGRWYLTFEGADRAGFEPPPLRLAY